MTASSPAALAPDFWNGRRVLLTGHTGFKGAWLSLWLDVLGARVTALALPPPTTPALIDVLAPWPGQFHRTGDIRDPAAVRRVFDEADPEIVLHLAAQALVRPSYADPVATYASNVMGTVNILEAARSRPGLKAVLVVTSDKVYENFGRQVPFAEDARLGGKDPYSNSKACCELVTASYRASFFGTGARLATARAGNVIGGGDWALDRLIPDVVRAVGSGRPVRLRNPGSVRPWQHVLEPLSGYLAYARRLVEAPAGLPDALNFGPDPESFRTVAEVVEAISRHFDGRPGWQQDDGEHPPEAPALTLNSELAGRILNWRPRLSIETALEWTAAWYAAHRAGAAMRPITLEQIRRFQNLTL